MHKHLDYQSANFSKVKIVIQEKDEIIRDLHLQLTYKNRQLSEVAQ